MKNISWQDFLELKKLNDDFSSHIVVTGSMEPIIKVGDRIIVDLKNKNFKVHDIIVFWMNGILICHTLIHINKIVSEQNQKVYLTAPYFQKGIDLPIREDHILGVVISHKLNWWSKLKLSWLHRK
jgi:signal peptidase I